MSFNIENVSISIEKLPDSELRIKGSLPFEIVASYRAKAVKELSGKVELPGFRKGHVPEAMLVSRVGEPAILEESAEFAFAELYPKLVEKHQFDPIGRPSIALTKLAPGNPVEFTLTTAVMPEVKLPDYKRIAAKVVAKPLDSAEVTDEELEKALLDIRRMLAGGQNPEAAKQGTLKDEELPELTDETVKGFGDYATLLDFRLKLREHLGKEKGQRAKEKRRIELTDKILEETDVPLPKLFVEAELEKMLGQMKSDVSRMGMKFEDYLKALKKTEDDLRADWKSEAAKRAKLQLALNEIAVKENISVPAEEVKREADHILEHFKDADRERVHIYAESVLRNEKTLALLETPRADA